MGGASFKGSDSYKGGEGGGPSGSTGKVYASATDETLNFLNLKLLAGPNISLSLSSGPDQALTIGGPGSQGSVYSDQLFEEALTTIIGGIFQNGLISGGPNNGTRAFSFITPMQMYIASMSIMIRQASGQVMRFCIYNASKNLIAQSSRFTPVPGINTIALNVPVLIPARTRIYVGYWDGDASGNTQFQMVDRCVASIADPPYQLSDLNEVPAAMGQGLDNTQFRPWLAFGS